MRYYYNYYDGVESDNLTRLEKILKRIFDDLFLGCGIEGTKLYIDLAAPINQSLLQIAIENILGVQYVDD